MGGPMEMTPREGRIGTGNSTPGDTTHPSPVVFHQTLPPRKSLTEAYLLGVPLGLLGAHHFYLGKYRMGILYLVTLGAFGVGWMTDLVRMNWLVKEANRHLLNPQARNKFTIADAYVLWFPCGIIGLHNYYLKRWIWAVAYTFSFGFCGIGWLVDGVRMRWIVTAANEKQEQEQQTGLPGKPKQLLDCYVLSVPPLGLLGAHHYYMENWLFGVFYTFTLGLFGVGWIVDLFRMPILLRRSNKRLLVGDDGLKTLDDAYLLLLPLGFLGLHHFYLRRVGWGFLYLFTFGCLGIGWIIDWFRLPMLTEDCNRIIMDEQRIVHDLQHQIGDRAQIIVGGTGYEVAYTPSIGGQAGPSTSAAISQPALKILQIPAQLYPASGYTSMTGNTPDTPPMDDTMMDGSQFPQMRPPAYETVMEEDIQRAAAYNNQAYQDLSNQPSRIPESSTGKYTTMDTLTEENEEPL